MPAKELTPQQKGEAVALLKLFKSWQDEQRALTGRRPSQAELADRLGFGQSALSQYLNGRIPLNEEVVLALSREMGVPPERVSPSIATSLHRKAEEGRRLGGDSPIPINNDSLPLGGVDREMIHIRPMIHFPRLKWEQVLMESEGGATLPVAFELEVADTALAPEFLPGHVLLFRTDVPPEAGRPVLIRDRDGAILIRRFVPSRPGVWTAAVDNTQAHRSLDSVTDGLVVLAASIGALWRPKSMEVQA